MIYSPTAQATVYIHDSSSWSYPLIDKLYDSSHQHQHEYFKGNCKVNANGAKQASGSDGFKGSDGDIILCKCSHPTQYTTDGMPKVPEFEIKKFAFAGTWNQENSFCSDKGGRLPYTNELCDTDDAEPNGGFCDGVGKGGTSSTTDKWAAVYDRGPLAVGEYAGCSSDLMDNGGGDKRGCEAHAVHAGGIPSWSNAGASARWKGWTYCRLEKE